MHGDANGSSPVEMNSIKADEAEKNHVSSTTTPLPPNGTTPPEATKQTNAKEMRVYYTGGDSSGLLRRGRLRTKLERYLIVLVVLLMCACLVFMIIALISNRTGKNIRTSLCHIRAHQLVRFTLLYHA